MAKSFIHKYGKVSRQSNLAASTVKREKTTRLSFDNQWALSSIKTFLDQVNPTIIENKTLKSLKQEGPTWFIKGLGDI